MATKIYRPSMPNYFGFTGDPLVDRARLKDEDEYAGLVLREAELDDVIHYFIYTADDYARVLAC